MLTNELLTAALEERYEYLEELKSLQEKVEKNIRITERDIDRMLLKLLDSTTEQDRIE